MVTLSDSLYVLSSKLVSFETEVSSRFPDKTKFFNAVRIYLDLVKGISLFIIIVRIDFGPLISPSKIWTWYLELIIIV